MKFPKPFFRTSKQAWYVQFGKRQISLGADQQEAFARYKELLAQEQHEPAALKKARVAQCFEEFLEHCHESCSEATYDWYRRLLSSADRHFGHLTLAQFQPLHVTRWLRSKQYADTTKAHAIGTVKAALNYCVKQGFIRENPIARMEKPPCAARERILEPAEREQLLAAVRDRRFRDYLFALQESGARPGEIAGLKREDVNIEGGYCVLVRHKNRRKTGKPRFIYCTPALLELLKERVAHTGPGEYLFTTRRGNPWSRHALFARFRYLRKKLPQLAGVVPYTLRHSFITESLERGVPDAVVAQLCGNSPEIIHRNYNHLSQKVQALREAAVKARGAGGDAAPGGKPPA